MRHTLRSLLVALALGIAPGALLASESPRIGPLSPEQAQSLLEGGTLRAVDRGSPMRAEVVALVQAPVEELAAIVADYNSATQWAPSIGACAITGEDGDALLVNGITQLPWPISDRTWQMRSRMTWQEIGGARAYVQSFNYVPGSGNINDSFGYWLLAPWEQDPSYTYVKYVVNADPGIAIPDTIVAWITRNALPRLISSLTERHELLY